MSQPTFTKSGVATFTFDRARSFPVDQPIKRIQIVGEAVAGQVKVADLGVEKQFIDIIADNLSTTNRDELITFLQDSDINWQGNWFTFTDEDSNTYTVRYWNSGGLLNHPEVQDNLVSIKIRLKVEIF